MRTFSDMKGGGERGGYVCIVSVAARYLFVRARVSTYLSIPGSIDRIKARHIDAMEAEPGTDETEPIGLQRKSE